MNAHIRNKCEAEALAAFVYIAKQLGVEITVETTPFEEGGLKEIWKFTTKPEVAYTNFMVVLGLLLNTFVALWNAPPKPDSELQAIQKDIAKATLEEKRLAIEKAKRELQKLGAEALVPVVPPNAENKVSVDVDGRVDGGTLQQQVERQVQKNTSVHPKARVLSETLSVLGEDSRFLTRRSNFYKALLPYDKVTAVGWGVEREDGSIDEAPIPKKDFIRFVLKTDKLPSNIIEEAVIQIAAPVITESGMQWKGFYEGEPISFSMKDNAFKDMVLRREVSFQSGNAIRCRLEIERKLDETGEPYITGYSVPVVIEKIDESGATETPQGRRRRFTDKQIAKQQNFFDPPTESGLG